MTEILTLKEYRKVKSNKYRNKRIQHINGEWFDSKGEHARYCELLLLERSGHIFYLKRQVPFDLIVNDQLICKYRADFTYYDLDKNYIVEDYKGFITSEFKLKEKLLKALRGIEIKITKK